MSDIERRLLSCLTDPAEIARVYDSGLRPEAFEEPITRAAYAFTIEYWLDSQMKMAPTPFVIEQEFPGFALLPDVEESPLWLAESLQRSCAVNDAQEMLREAAASLHEDPIAALRKLHASAYQAVERVSPRLLRSDMTDPQERRQRYVERNQRPGGIGLTLGIPELDAHIGGIMPGELVALGAFAKTGKTWFLVNAAVSLRKAGYTPIFFTLEMSIAEIEDRIDAMFSGVSYSSLSHGDLNHEQMQRLTQAQDSLAEMGGILVESPEEGDRTVASMLARARQAGADLVIIDQLSHMEAGRRTRDLKDHRGTVLKQLSIELSRPRQELPCLLAVQLRRPDKDSKASGDIELHHFADAAETEREVDLALGLSRTGQERQNNAMKLRMLGSRRSDIKNWLLNWQLSERTEISVLEELR
ncbi:DnaB-like helicase C-terminal domain-containing protein [Mycolicibacter kumamotonensis]|uniref:SF4 helicase domain-containing protein n=1 Tax=Mycolicibacter kumamotonensis TaxID=354243 RepID=A0A1B8SL84_9MYCO|nr:DnaB-like helicase C-terminal domain-containing protein [Mycolicibacter kumamotonensis]OBY33499.1 hypothetical protein ACT18_00710 [Mycolicibacter kumamotonensis]